MKSRFTIPDKTVYMKEVSKIDNMATRSKLEKIYNHLLGTEKIKNIYGYIEEVLSEIFPNTFTNDVLIPLKFHNTIIGKVLFSIMYCNIEPIYSMKELKEITGFTNQYLGQEISDGNLQGEKKNGRWYFSESQISEYLKRKNIDWEQ